MRINDLNKITKEDDEGQAGVLTTSDDYRGADAANLQLTKSKLEKLILELEMNINFRAENSHKFFNSGDKAGTGDLYNMKDALEKIHAGWDESSEIYGM